ncbi:hypothetical protein [Paenibacillus nasutitermitis]|uniref:Uncharacterized protein n=1 Tax=Paenibacillus nasutitermitis TaxID=1652958 RepID=A0A917DMS3_9BACL|nr:hypothetical protein [Paenibacillus nasutitermitis]GGD53481.1 hypothetical protein GCM10010911_08810 [Paenibacillus nasutitermitis]
MEDHRFGRPVAAITAEEICQPPEWALLQRLLLDTMNQGAMEFVDRYTRKDRTLIWREFWPGMDGSDDPYEGFMNFPLLYALGGNEELYRVSREIWEAITWQWTEYGQIHNEFDAYYDWMHHGEGYLFFYFFGLADPRVLKDKQRAVRFAGFYGGDNPDVPNYDKKKKLIRSPITGSRGPRFQQTAEDWETHREILDNYLPPFEDIPGVDRYGSSCPWSDDEVYKEILLRINDRQARGDVPLNLCATSMITHAYMYTEDDAYRSWVLEYLEAWKERTAKNGGIMPDNIGLSGDIGEYNDGKWWGGYYGWRWPHGAVTILEPTIIAGSNAVLLTGDYSHLDLARSQIDRLWSMAREEDGKYLVPNRHYDEGWRDYRIPHPMFAVYVWNISMDEADAQRAERGWSSPHFDRIDSRYSSYGQQTNGGHMGFNGNTAQWFRYIRGKDPDYPVGILRSNYAMIQAQLKKIRSPEYAPEKTALSQAALSIHQWQELTPVLVEGLAQLTMGAPMHVYHGGLQHARVRYFDALAKRPGLPDSVAALVEKLAGDSVTLRLVNLSLFEARDVIVQAGTFGEHEFTAAQKLTEEGEVCGMQQVQGKWLLVRMAAGTGVRLRLGMNRYVNQPTYETPWSASEEAEKIVQGRNQEQDTSK